MSDRTSSSEQTTFDHPLPRCSISVRSISSTERHCAALLCERGARRSRVIRNRRDASLLTVEHPGVALMCYPYHRGGVTRWMLDAAAEWTRQGVRCWSVAPVPREPFVSGGNRPTIAELSSDLPLSVRPTIIRPRVGSEFEFGTMAYRASVYARAVREVVPPGVPIIPADDPSVWLGASWISSSHPMVGVLHADDAAYYALAQQHAPRLAALACVSSRIAVRARALLEDAAMPIATIPCGIPIPERHSGSPHDPAPLRLIWVGRMEERQKRVTDLPKIADALRESGLDFRLTIMGDGPDRTGVERAVRERSLDDVVRLTGWRDSTMVSALLRESDLFLAPSNFEGFSVAVMEALAAGCGVVASRVSGIEDYENVPLATECLWVHAVGDIAEAVKSIHSAAQIPKARRASAARAFACQEFNIATCTSRYDALLTSLASPMGTSLEERSWAALAATLLSRPIAATRRARLWMSAR